MIVCWERIRSRLSILSMWVLVCTFTSTTKPPWSTFNWWVCLRFPWESLTSLKPRSLRGYQAVCRLHQKFCRRRKTMFGKKTEKSSRRSCFPVSRMFHYSLCISSSSFWHPEMPNHAVVCVTTELHQCICFRSSSGCRNNMDCFIFA